MAPRVPEIEYDRWFEMPYIMKKGLPCPGNFSSVTLRVSSSFIALRIKSFSGLGCAPSWPAGDRRTIKRKIIKYRIMTLIQVNDYLLVGMGRRVLSICITGF